MGSIRKRKWTHAGKVRDAWVVDYVTRTVNAA
jgi:hypothetical protein